MPLAMHAQLALAPNARILTASAFVIDGLDVYALATDLLDQSGFISGDRLALGAHRTRRTVRPLLEAGLGLPPAPYLPRRPPSLRPMRRTALHSLGDLRP